MSQAETLQRLASTPVRDLVSIDTQGEKELFYHYLACCTSKLVLSPDATDDIARLHALFDVAVSHGLPSLIVDYVEDVCADSSLTSSDERDAYLLDGECVSRWCLRTLRIASDRIRSILAGGLRSDRAAAAVDAELQRLSGLDLVVQALLGLSGSSLELHSEEASRLRQCGQVMAWVIQQGIHKSSSSGGFSSSQEWQLSVHRRRDAAKPGFTFLQDLLTELATKHGAEQNFQYPPASLERALEGLFLQGATDDSAHRLKLSLFAYYLLDVGHRAALQSLGRNFLLSSGELALWQAYFFLDEALLHQPGNLALETACSLLPVAASQSPPFKFVEVLAARGAFQAALMLLRFVGARAVNKPDQELKEAKTAVRVLLESKLVTQAYIEIRQYCSKIEGSQLRRYSQELVTCLADWAAQNGFLGRILQLPLLGAEEEALLDWLEQKIAAEDPQGDFLVLFFLLRQRFPEGMAAFARLAPIAGGEAEGLRALLKDMLRSSSHLLPLAQRSLVLHDPSHLPALSLSSDNLRRLDQPGISLAAALDVPTGEIATLHVCGSASAQPPLFGSLATTHEDIGSARASGDGVIDVKSHLIATSRSTEKPEPLPFLFQKGQGSRDPLDNGHSGKFEVPGQSSAFGQGTGRDVFGGAAGSKGSQAGRQRRRRP